MGEIHVNDGHADLMDKGPYIAAGTPATSPAVPAAARRLQRLVFRPGALTVLRILQPVRRLGAWGGAGLAMLAVATMGMLFSVLPAIHERDVLQAQLATEQGRGKLALPSAVTTPRSFLSKLPGRPELPAILATVVAQAQAAHLELHEGNYELIEGKGGTGQRYRMTLPVTGRYVDVRKFVDGTLAAVPAAALDSISLSRDDINSAVVVADLRFLVYLRGRQ